MGIRLRSERLILREIDASDFDFLYSMELLPETVVYEKDEPDPKEKCVEKYRWYIDKANEVPESGGLYFIIHLADTNEAIGRAHIHCNWELVREWEIGYALLPAHWGRGYASEAAMALVRYAFDKIHAHKVVAFCNAENRRSAKLLERIGMTREGYLREDRLIRGQWYDSCFYSFLKRDLEK